MESLRIENTLKAKRIDSLENRVDKIEAEKRKLNLLVHGVPETTGENPRVVINDLLTDLVTETTVNDCNAIYRLGQKFQTGRTNPRPILVHLARASSKGDIYGKVNKLKDLQRRTRISISPAFPMVSTWLT